MNGFRNLKLTARLALAFGALLTIMALMGVIAIWRLNVVAAKSHVIARNWLPSVEYLGAMNTAKAELRVKQIRLAIATTSEEVTQFDKLAQEWISAVEEKKRLYLPLMADDKARSLWNDFDRKWQAYLEFSNKLSTAARQGKHQEATQLMVDSLSDYTALGEALERDVDQNVAGANKEAQQAEEIYATSRTVIIGMILLAIMAGALVAVVSGRAITRPLSGIIDIFKRIAAGKLDNDIEVDRRDEIGAVLTNLDEMQRQMRKLLAEIQGHLSAITRVQAVIEFDLKGTVLTANENFLNALGYRLDEIKGQHHSVLVDPADRASEDYRRFWEKLARGEYDLAQYKHIAKGGKAVWLQASYNPILDADGKPHKVVMYATDVTGQVNLTRQMEAAVVQTQEVVRSAAEGTWQSAWRLKTRVAIWARWRTRSTSCCRAWVRSSRA